MAKPIIDARLTGYQISITADEYALVESALHFGQTIEDGRPHDYRDGMNTLRMRLMAEVGDAQRDFQQRKSTIIE